MTGRKSKLAFGAIILTVTGTALADLDHEDVGVERIDISSPDRVVIQLDRTISVGTCAGSNNQQIACDLDDKYCEPAMRVALSAQLSGRKISFNKGTDCVGSFVRFTRLRNNNL